MKYNLTCVRAELIEECDPDGTRTIQKTDRESFWIDWEKLRDERRFLYWLDLENEPGELIVTRKPRVLEREAWVELLNVCLHKGETRESKPNAMTVAMHVQQCECDLDPEIESDFRPAFKTQQRN